MEWDEALDFAAAGLRRVRDDHGRDAVATYLGNPGAHTWSVLSFLALRLVLGTSNNSSATSTDQLPQHLTSAEMFGNLAMFPIPDVDRTQHMLVLGANPAVSNGSIMSAPGVRDRLRGILGRGGTVVVVDPRRTETAKLATEHVQVRPGGDPYLLLGMLHVLFAEELVDLGAAGRAHRRPGPGPGAGLGVAARAVRRAGGRRGRRPSPGWRASSPPRRPPWPTGGWACASSRPGRSRTG